MYFHSTQVVLLKERVWNLLSHSLTRDTTTENLRAHTAAPLDPPPSAVTRQPEVSLCRGDCVRLKIRTLRSLDIGCRNIIFRS